jgi:hypothetical protein
MLQLEGSQLLDYGQYKYSSEFDEILCPHIGLLHKLTFLSGKVAIGDCPALAYLSKGKVLSGNQLDAVQIKNGLVMFTGNLSLDECAMIHNWFENVVSGAAQVKSKWLQCVPIAHAITLVICHRN